jgi:hypothetical protein
VTTVIRQRRGFSDIVLLISGALLAFFGLSPFMIELRFYLFH